MKAAAILFSPEEILVLKQVLLDRDAEGALAFLKEIHRRIQESQNKTLNTGI